jgi:hypothetical protein
VCQCVCVTVFVRASVRARVRAHRDARRTRACVQDRTSGCAPCLGRRHVSHNHISSPRLSRPHLVDGALLPRLPPSNMGGGVRGPCTANSRGPLSRRRPPPAPPNETGSSRAPGRGGAGDGGAGRGRHGRVPARCAQGANPARLERWGEVGAPIRNATTACSCKKRRERCARAHVQAARQRQTGVGWGVKGVPYRAHAFAVTASRWPTESVLRL